MLLLLVLLILLELLLPQVPAQLSLSVSEGAPLGGEGVLFHGKGDVGQLDISVGHPMAVAGQHGLDQLQHDLLGALLMAQIMGQERQ